MSALHVPMYIYIYNITTPVHFWYSCILVSTVLYSVAQAAISGTNTLVNIESYSVESLW
jgi:hypothetical protein